MVTAIILAGGQGTRLKPLTTGVPKPLLRTPHKTIMEHQLQSLYDAGVHSVYVLINQTQKDAYKTYLDGLDMRHYMRIVLIPETVGLGTAGAIVNCLWSHPELSQLPYVLVLNGDIVCRYSFTSLIERYRSSDCSCLLAHITTKDPSQYGLIQLTDLDKSVSASSFSCSTVSNPSLSSFSDHAELVDTRATSSFGSLIPEYSQGIGPVLSSMSASFEPDVCENSASEEVVSYGPDVDVRQIVRIEEYSKIHSNGSTSISRRVTPHHPSSPAGLHTNVGSAKKLVRSSSHSAIDPSAKHSTEPLQSQRTKSRLSGTSTARRGGVIKFGRVLRFIEKSSSVTKERAKSQHTSKERLHAVNAGIYILDPTLLLSFPVPCSMEYDVFPALLSKGAKIYSAYVGTEDTWSDMGTVAGFIKGCQLIHKVPVFNTESASLSTVSVAGKGQKTSDKQGSRQGHRPQASTLKSTNTDGGIMRDYGRGNVISASSHVSGYTTLTNCLVYDNVTIPPRVYLDNCIICSGAQVVSGRSYYNKILC